MKKIFSIIKLGLVSAVALGTFSGCGVKIPVNKQLGQLNLQYTSSAQEARVDKKIAIVSAKFSEQEQSNNNAPKNPFTGKSLILSNVNVNFNSIFLSSYQNSLTKSMNNGFEELVLKKGFVIGGKYKTFDDMTYPDRKSTYMALIPELDINIMKKASSSDRGRLHYSEKGVIQVTGEMTVKMVEPLSKQMFISKRINLSDLKIKKPYTYEVQVTTSNASGIGVGSMVSGAMDKASAPDMLIDTTDKALAEALNEFYAKAMPKIEKYLSQEEILSLEKDVMSAKGKTGGTW